MDSADFLTWLHVLAMSAYFGAQFAVIYMLLPAAEQAGDEQRRRAALIAGFKFYNPFTIAMLGIVVVTGAMRLTGIKAELKFDYFARIWAALSLKLMLAFLLIFIQTYITFGLSFRIGRQEEVAAHGDGEPFTVERLNSMLARIRTMTWVTILLTAAVIFVSLTFMKRAVTETAGASTDAMIVPAHRHRTICAVDSQHLVQADQRGYDPREGQDSEHDAGKLVQHRVLRAIHRLAGAGGFIDRQSRDGCFVRSCVHVPCSFVPAFRSASLMSLVQAQQRGYDPGEGQDSEHDARKLVQHRILRAMERLAGALGFVSAQSGNGCFIDSCVHLSPSVQARYEEG
jgi:uncharacterized membrane protein